MVQSLKVVRTRIRSVESIKKLTRSMEMVSSARLRSSQKELYILREYSLRIEKMLSNLLTNAENVNHSLLTPRRAKKNILLCLVTSDTGLCGSYNSAVIRLTEEFIRDNNAYKTSLMIIGKKGFNHFRKTGIEIVDSYAELCGRYSQKTADKIAQKIMGIFLSGQADEVYMVYTNFESAARRRLVLEKILNIEKKTGEKAEYITEPDLASLLDEIIPLYFINKIRMVILSAFTAEHATRVMAMNEATKNAKDLLEDLVLLRNKMRQAQITVELIELISSANAMRG